MQFNLKKREDDAEALYYLAVSLHETGNYSNSKDASQKLIEKRGDWDDAWHVLAMALQALGDKEGAITAYRKALAINPLNEDAADKLNGILED